MPRFLLVAALAMLTAARPVSAQAPDLDGVFLGAQGDGSFSYSGLAQFNPVENAPVVYLTPYFPAITSMSTRDSLRYRGEMIPRVIGGNGAGRNAYGPDMAPTGRMVYATDWFNNPETGFRQTSIVAQDRDGSNQVVLAIPNTGTASLVGVEISNDGQMVLYTVVSLTRYEAIGDLYLLPADGSAEPVQLPLPEPSNPDEPRATGCLGNAARATFSPDGTRILYIGFHPYLFEAVDGSTQFTVCQPALRSINVDGTDDQLIHPIARGTEQIDGYADSNIALDWKEGRILYSHPTSCRRYTQAMRFEDCIPFDPQPHPPAPYVFDTEEEEEREIRGIGTYIPASFKLSPDGDYMGFTRTGGDRGHTIVVHPLDGSGDQYEFNTFPGGRTAQFAWADVPKIPEPDRLVMETDDPGVLIWEGRTSRVTPTLYGTDGSVISRLGGTWENTTGGFTFFNVFTGEPGYRFDEYGHQYCASNGGQRDCVIVNAANKPLIAGEILDNDIQEEGRNPGVLRLYRYGRPDVDIIPAFLTTGPARHYLDYTLSPLPERIFWAGSDALADTLVTRDIVLTPIDDGVAESGEFESGIVYIDCVSGSLGFFGPDEENCTVANEIARIPGLDPEDMAGYRGRINWEIFIRDNGAGSGLGIAASAPGAIPSDGQATLTINGQGFAEGATATLSGPGSITAENVSIRENGVQALARFVMDGAPPGLYDLTVTSGGETATLEDAVEVVGGAPGGTVNVWATLQSQSGRPGLPARQFIHYGNDGTADAELTPVVIAIPEGYTPEIVEDLLEYPGLPDDYVFDVWIEHEIPQDLQRQLCGRPQFGAGNLTLASTSGGFSCDALFGFTRESLTYQVALVFIPTIPAGGRGTIALDVTREADAESVLPFFVRIGAPLNSLDYDEGEDVEALAAKMWAGGERRTVPTPTNVQGCESGAGVGAAFQGSVFDEAQGAACVACVGTLLGIVVAGAAPCVKSAVSTARNALQTLVDAATGADGYALLADGGTVMGGSRLRTRRVQRRPNRKSSSWRPCTRLIRTLHHSCRAWIALGCHCGTSSGRSPLGTRTTNWGRSGSGNRTTSRGSGGRATPSVSRTSPLRRPPPWRLS